MTSPWDNKTGLILGATAPSAEIPITLSSLLAKKEGLSHRNGAGGALGHSTGPTERDVRHRSPKDESTQGTRALQAAYQLSSVN